MTPQQKQVLKTGYQEIEPYKTKDGSIIRELMHPDVHGNSKMSLAEATLPIATATALHQHRSSEEIYHITAGSGRLTLGGKTFDLTVGDTVCIPSETPHQLENTGTTSLKVICCCAPPYSHDDTELIVPGFHK